MTRKEIYYFLGKCLILNDIKDLKQSISDSIKDPEFPWDLFVEIGSNHLILPAVYQRLLDSGLLIHLPKDLCLYLKEINQLNLDRNQRIISQIREINTTLVDSGINPVFIKGSAAIIDGLYQHRADRITADIDCLIPYDKSQEATRLIIEKGFSAEKSKFQELPTQQHLPTLFKPGEASIDLHIRPVIEPYSRLLAGWEDRIRISGPPEQENQQEFVLSNADQALLNFLHSQFQDRGQFFANVSLRSAYEMYLMLKREDVSGPLLRKHQNFSRYLNNYLAMLSGLFYPFSPEGYRSRFTSKLFILRLELNKTSRLYHRTSKLFRTITLQIFHYSSIIIRASYSKEYRLYLSSRLFIRGWYRSHLHTIRSRLLK